MRWVNQCAYRRENVSEVKKKRREEEQEDVQECRAPSGIN